MLNKIKLAEKALVSVVFFNVENGDTHGNNIVEFLTLSTPSADKIKKLDNITTCKLLTFA